jgi:predicted dienelactone hydrolase
MGHSFGGYSAFALAGATFDVDGITPACLDGSDTSEFCTGMGVDDVDRLRTGFADDRVDAVMAMAPGDWRLFNEGLTDIDIPTLHMTGDIDPNGGDNESIWASLDGPDATRVDITNGGHMTFTDLSGSSLDPSTVLQPEQADPIVFAYTLAFARRWTGEDALEPVLAGDVLNLDSMTLSHKP